MVAKMVGAHDTIKGQDFQIFFSLAIQCVYKPGNWITLFTTSFMAVVYTSL